MNETNHKRVIYGLNINADLETLNAASKFTDSIKASDDYFYYHFYYDINIHGNTIQLMRVDEKEKDAFEKSMEMCGDKYDLETKEYYSDLSQKGRLISSPNREWSTATNKKEFFSTFINGRNKSEKLIVQDVIGKKFSELGNNSLMDVGNQSDNVAFLHAMAAVDEDTKTALSVFKEHLKKCFTEYLFILDPQKAQFILGVALHGIMDSFTPSHMGFQNYAKQDWGLHAQGDVIPFHGDTVYFDPGQAAKESWLNQLFFDLKKDYNSDIHLNNQEFEMFKIYATIAGLDEDEEVKMVLDGETSLIDYLSLNMNPNVLGKIEMVTYEPRSRAKLNKILKYKLFRKTAFVYSDTAICVCKKVYEDLCIAKSRIEDYKGYKNEKTVKKDNAIDAAINTWEEEYVKLESQREDLFDKIRSIRGFSDVDKKNKKNPFAK